MQTEIEVKFCQVDIVDMRQRLTAAGATLEHPMRSMRRQVFYTVDDNPDAFIRVRAEGDKNTLTYKRFETTGLHGAKEVETTVSDYEATVTALTEVGLRTKSIQETKRETWVLGEVEVVIDEWPWLEPFIEIEGPSESAVRDAATALKLDWDDAVFGAVTAAYRVSYPHLLSDLTMNDVPEIRFEADLPDRLKL